MKTSMPNEIVALAIETWTKSQHRTVDVTTFAQNLLGMKDAKGQPLLSEQEMKYPAAVLMLNQLTRSFREMTSDPNVRAAWISSRGFETVREPAEKKHGEEITGLKEELARLNKVVAEKDREIKNLKKNR